jgi:hypothetical protein
MTSDEFVRMVVQGAVQLMMERGGMILAKEYEGELWIKASDHYDEVNRSVDAEREACAALCFQMWNESLDRRKFNHPDAEDCAAAIRARGQE